MKVISILALLFGLAHAADLRTWTDVQDRKIEAALVRVEKESVVLKLKDGREIPYPLAKLSPADGKYVDEMRATLTGAKPTKAASDDAKKLNFSDPWPNMVKYSEDPQIKTVEENAGEKRFIYESAHYRYVCDAKLEKAVVKVFAVLFEATHLYCRTLPLAFNGGTMTDGKYQILLFEKFDDYVKAGGPPSSAGVFGGGRNAVLIPLISLGVKPLGKEYLVDYKKSSRTVPHELTHQLSPVPYFEKGAMGWFSEGIAEYVAATRYSFGSFNVQVSQKDIIEYVTAYGKKEQGGRGLGTKIRMPALKTFMLQDYASFQEQAQLSYGCSLLLTDYFLHMDGAGDGKRIKAFLNALQEGKDGVSSLDLLLDGRTFEKLQEDYTKAWSRKGIDFTFPKE